MNARKLLCALAIGGLTTACCEFGGAFGTRAASGTEVAPSAPPSSSTPALRDEAMPATAPSPEAAEPPATPRTAAPASELDLRASDLETWRAEPDGILGPTRMVPRVGEEGGGLVLYGIRSHTPMAELGFQNGDVVHTLNGMSVSDEESLRAAFEQLRVTDTYRAEVIRRGSPETLLVHVRED